MGAIGRTADPQPDSAIRPAQPLGLLFEHASKALSANPSMLLLCRNRVRLWRAARRELLLVLRWRHLHPVLLSPNPEPIEKIDPSILVERHIARLMVAIALRRFDINKRGVLPR